MKHGNIYKKIIIASIALMLGIGGVFALYSFGITSAHAAINKEINYQGKLTNASNVAVADGLYNMEFKLYTTLTGGSAIFTETLTTTNRVQVTNGLFSVMLGSTTPLTGVDFNQTLYLGVKIESDAEMSPRKIIGAVPAAFVSDTLDNLSSEQFLRSDAQNATSSTNTFLNIIQTGAGKVAEFFGSASQSVLSILSNGNVGIGTTSPYAKLSVDGRGVFNQDVRADYFTATSTTIASTFSYASTTALTVSGTNGLQLASGLNGPLQAVNGLVSSTSTMSVAYGGTGLSTVPSYGNLLVGNALGGYTLTATSSLGLANFAYLFPSNATSTLLSFNGGLTSYASTTIGNGTQTGGLTISGGATTTGNAYFAGNVGVGTTSPATTLSVAGSGYFTGGLGVGVLNTTPNTFQVGLCVTGDTLLRRRRKKRLGEKADKSKGESEDADYIYGEVMIKDVSAGDEIQTLDTKTGKLVWSKIKQLAYMGVKGIFSITTMGGKNIRTTANHPYFVRSKDNQAPKQKNTKTLEMDQSIRIEELNEDTIFGIANTEYKTSFRLSKYTKRFLFEMFRLHGMKKHFAPVVFALCAGLTIKKAKFTSQIIVIDFEYTGYEILISQIIAAMGIESDIHWKSIGKNSPAHIVSYFTHKKKIPPAGDITQRDILEILNLDMSMDQDMEGNRKSRGTVTHRVYDDSQSKRPSRMPMLANGRAFVKQIIEEISTAPKRHIISDENGLWTKVINIRVGQEIAVSADNGKEAIWDRVSIIREMKEEDVYDIEVEGTHNFIGNGIVAHNTAFLVNSSGNVGIGTSSPYAQLSVERLSTTGTVIGTDALTGFTGNLLDMKVASTSKFTVNYLGNITGANASLSGASITNSSASLIPLTVTGAISQTGDMLQILNSSSSPLFKIDASGNQEALGYYTNGSGSIGQYQNLLTYSEQFDNAIWTTSNTTVTPNTTVAPDGMTTADTLTSTVNGGSVSQDSGVAASGTHTFSVWLKTSSGTQSVTLRQKNSTGTESSSSAMSVGTTWKRYTVTYTFAIGSGTIVTWIFPGGTGGTGTILAWGAQLSAGSSALAYSRTSGATSALGSGVLSGSGLFTAPTATIIPLVAQGASSQTADLFQLKNSSGNVLSVFNSSGNLGIGTTSPYAALSVNGRGVFNQDVRADYFTATSTSVASTFPYASTTALTVSGSTYLTGLGSAAALAFDTNGKLYGFATSTWTFASSTLLSDSNTFSGANAFAGLTATSFNLGSGLANMLAGFDASGNLTSTSSPQVAYINATSTTATSTFAGGITGPGSFTVQSSSGNVGIGTTSPTNMLEVAGSGYFAGNLTTSMLTATSTTASSSIMSALGIGLSNPSAKLDIRGSSSGGSLVNMLRFSDGASGYYNSIKTGVGGSGGQNSFAFITAKGGVETNPFTVADNMVTFNVKPSFSTPVGINNTNPQAILDISTTTNGGGTLQEFLRFSSNDVNYHGSIKASAGGSAGQNKLGLFLTSIGVETNPILLADNLNTINGTTTFSGNVGIGTTSPYAALSVAGRGVFNQDVRADYFTATSTSIASTFPYASTTMVTATTASTTNLIISGLGGASTRCLQVNTDGTVAANASACGTGSGTFSWTPTTFGSTAANSTSTLIGFTAGFYSLASSTIGNGTQTGGLTISGGATTTGNAYFAGNVGIGTTSPGYTLDVNGAISGTSILAQSGTAGRYASLTQSNSQLTLQAYSAGAGASITMYGASAGVQDITFTPYSTGGYSFPGTGTAKFTGNVGIGTTSPYAALSVNGRGVFNQDVRADYFTATSTSIASTFPYASTTALTVSGSTYLTGLGAAAALAFDTNGKLYGFSTSTWTFASSTLLSDSNTFSGTNTFASLTATSFNLGSGLANMLAGFDASGNLTSTSSPQVAYINATSTTATSTFAGGFSTGSLGINAFANGNVGIGTTTPTALLDVQGTLNGGTSLQRGINLVADSNPGVQGLGGTINITAGHSGGASRNGGAVNISAGNGGDVTGVGGAITLTPGAGAPANSSTGGALVLRGGLGGTGGGAGGAITFSTALTNTLAEAMRISNTGNVGIGTTTPYAALSVVGRGVFNQDVRADYFTATSTSIASTFPYASTTMVTATTASTTNLIISGLGGASTRCLQVNTDGTVAANASACGTGSGTFSWTPTTFGSTAANSTSTLIGFTAGLYSLASSTIGDGTQTGGLTISGGATTTGNAYFAGNVGIGTASPIQTLDMKAGGTYGYNGAIMVQASTTLSNWFFGNAGNLTMTGVEQTGVGSLALTNTTSGTKNTAIGYKAGYLNSTGNYNVFMGDSAGYNSTTTAGAVYIGYQAGYAATSTSYDTFVGYQAGYNTSNTIGTYQGGNSNTALGYQALYTNTYGQRNVAIGDGALLSNTTGGYNVAMGGMGAYGILAALYRNTTGTSNTAIGSGAMGNNVTGGSNTALGQSALNANLSSFNTAIGLGSLSKNTSGSYNTAIGNNSGLTLLSGSNNLFVGYGADTTLVASTTLTNSTAIGYNAIVDQSNSLVLGGTGANAVNVGIGTTSPYAALSVAGRGVFNQDVRADYFTATSTSVASTFSYASTTMVTATTASTTNLIISGLGGASTRCLQVNTDGTVAANASACGTGSGGASYDWQQLTDTFGVNALTPTSTIPIWIKSTATSTFAGGIESWAMIGAPYFNATSTTATSVFAGGLSVAGSAGLMVLQNGMVGIGTSSPYAKLSVVGQVVADSFFATSTTATSTFAGGLNVGNGGLVYESATGITSVTGLQLGSMNFDADAGIVPWIDLPISAATVGTVESYIANIGSQPVLTVYGESDGAGSSQNLRVGIGTTTPWRTLSVVGNSDLGSNALAGYFTSTSTTASVFPYASTTALTVSGSAFFPGSGIWNSSGFVGIGTTSPYAALSVNGRGVFNQDIRADYFTATSTSIASTFSYASTTALTVSGSAFFPGSGIWNSSGFVGIGTTSPYAALSVVGASGVVADIYTATSTTATSTFAGGLNVGAGNFMYDLSTGVTSAAAFQTGNLNFDTDAGMVSWADLPLSSASSGTIQGYTAFLNGSSTISVYGVSAGSGYLQNDWPRVSIGSTGAGTSTPTSKLTVFGNGTGTGGIFELVDNASTTLFKVLDNGVFTASTTNSANATSTINGNLYVNGTLRSTLSYVGDLIFANNFSFTEAPLGTTTAQGLLLRNQYGKDVFTADENGNLSVVGDVCYKGNQCFGKSLNSLENYVNILASSTAESLFSAQDTTTTSLSGLTVSLSNINQTLNTIVDQQNDISSSTVRMIDQAVSDLTASTTFLANIASSTADTLASSTPSFITRVASAVLDSLKSATDWVFAKITASLAVFDRVETKTAAISQGLEMTDQTNGQIYCVGIKNGDWSKVPGSCASQQNNQPATTTAVASVPQTIISPPISPATTTSPTTSLATTTSQVSSTTPATSGTPPTDTQTSTPTSTSTSTSTSTTGSVTTTTTTDTASSTAPVTSSPSVPNTTTDSTSGTSGSTPTSSVSPTDTTTTTTTEPAPTTTTEPAPTTTSDTTPPPTPTPTDSSPVSTTP